MKRYIFLKLGGSLITDKEKPFTVKRKNIIELACQIKAALDEDKNLRLVIGNGAGSFAHYPAAKYKMKDGIKEDNQIMGFCEVQNAASRLNRIIVAELLKVGVRAIGLNPSSMMVTRGGKVKKFFIDPIIDLLALGITPVVFGDIVFDEKTGACIFSTEKILKEIALRFVKKGFLLAKIIHTGITRGVIDNKGEIIPQISRDNYGNFVKQINGAKGFDVTGGMLHKVNESLELAKSGIKSLILNGVSEKNLLKRALLEQEVSGTMIN